MVQPSAVHIVSLFCSFVLSLYSFAHQLSQSGSGVGLGVGAAVAGVGAGVGSLQEIAYAVLPLSEVSGVQVTPEGLQKQ